MNAPFGGDSPFGMRSLGVVAGCEGEAEEFDGEAGGDEGCALGWMAQEREGGDNDRASEEQEQHADELQPLPPGMKSGYQEMR